MKNINIIISIWSLLIMMSCQKEQKSEKVTDTDSNLIQFAQNFSIYDYDGFKLLQVRNISPDSEHTETYVLHKKETVIPDSLRKYTLITIPIQHIIVTSTTHIPSIEMLHQEHTLVGFPGLDYISSPGIRSLIDQGKIKEVGKNEQLNTESVLELNPEVLVSFAITQNNQTLENLKNSGIKVLLNGDWNEKHPLGKAEWIKFFGALYDKESEATKIFDQIKSDYTQAKEMAQATTKTPTIITGNIYEDVWYMPKGDSWAAVFLADAHTYYPWSATSGTGSLALSFEEVFEKAQQADYWIGAGSYISIEEMLKANPHYKEFKAFKEGNVYTYSTKKGATGGVIYFELAPNRPDLVLKDIIKITHPELLKEYELQFFEALK